MKAAPFSMGALLALALVSAPVLAQGNGVGSQFELAFWDAVADSDDAAQYQAYLAQYPEGTFAAIARLKIAALGGSVPVVALPAPVAPAIAVAVSAAAPPAPVAAPILPSPPPPLPPPPPPPLQTAAPSVVAMAVPAPVVAPAPTPAAPVDTRAELIARAGSIEAGTAPQASVINLPAVPQLAAVPQVAIPPTFCSALERNGYHDNVYRPARRVAQDNNRAAIAYLRQLQEMYDGYLPARDFERMNLIADAAQAYEPIADDTYQITVNYDSLFDRLMAVRIVDCAAGQ